MCRAFSFHSDRTAHEIMDFPSLDLSQALSNTPRIAMAPDAPVVSVDTHGASAIKFAHLTLYVWRQDDDI